MSMEIVEFLQFLSPEATTADLMSACRRIVDGSDLVRCAIALPYTDSERDAIAQGIFRFILNLDMKESQEIVFDSEHLLVGAAIEYFEFASMFSSEFLSDYCKETWENPFPDLISHAFRVYEYYIVLSAHLARLSRRKS